MTATCEQILAAAEQQKLVEDRIRRAQPVGRIWDAEWNCQHVMGSEYSAQFSWISNDTGPGRTEFPYESPIAQWIYDYQARLDAGSGRTVAITIDYCGARWSGMLDKFAVEQREDGDVVLVVDWVHDYEHLKWYSVIPNPFLPDGFQAPRAWLLAGPVPWILKVSLFLAIWREHNPFLTWPDDPLDLNNWASMGLDMSDWHIVVKPQSFIQALQSGAVWGVVTSRWQNFHDMAHYMLEDSELSIVCRRYLPGDELPWAGANLRYGTLVIDVADKSGVLIGTSNGGSVFDGLTRTALEFADDFIDSTYDVVSDADTPQDYFTVGKRYTDPVKPYVIFYESDTSPVQTSSWIYSPAKGVQIEVGGHSAPGVNEAISATIQALGDVLGGLAQIGSLGGTIDTLLAPIYEDCVAEDTLIDGPDGKERIDVLTERGEPFRVWSIDGAGQKVPATALLAFKKGNAELFEYVLENGSVLKATKQHRWLTPQGWAETGKAVVGTCVGVDSSQHFSMVKSIKSLGFQDFYDMHVPGLENYLAEGIWNHNTVLAWQTFKSPERANNTGWDRLHAYFQDGAGKAYTLASLAVLRAGMWATKTVVSWRVQVSDGAPYLVGDNGVGHFFLDDRVGLVLKADDKIHMDRCRRIDLGWGPDTPPEWTINIGDERIWQDPAQRALGRIERLIAGLHDLGVW